MTMTEALIVLLAGGLLGFGIFGCLWWTIERAVVSSQPASWFIGSLLACLFARACLADVGGVLLGC